MAETQPPGDSGSFRKHPEVLTGSVTVLLLRKMLVSGSRKDPKGGLSYLDGPTYISERGLGPRKQKSGLLGHMLG